VVRDGEGARKQVEVTVTGAKSAKSAKRIALSIANSPLVKTAVAGEDANWGRVVMAVGKSGEPADRDRLAIWFGDNRLAFEGERDPDYSEERTSAYMKGDEIRIRADIGLGRGKATVWTCDLTKEYVAINGDYRSCCVVLPTGGRPGSGLPIVRRFEAAAFRAWPAAAVHYDGTWITRLNAGHPAKRLNSVNPLDPSDVTSIAERVERANRRFEAYGRPLTFRLSPLGGRELTQFFDRQGWDLLSDRWSCALR
jgi:hypothetical protein